jgi:hypothetical protein
MSQRTDPTIEVKLEAAFDRYNRAVITGMEPTPALFMEALEAEGLSLSLMGPESADATSARRRASDRSARPTTLPVGRRAQGLLARRVRGLF